MEKTIYKLDSKGKIRFLKISTSGISMFQESGLLGGNSVIHENKCFPKNIGKINATTSSEQAEIEASAKIVQKLREGYSETIEEARGLTLVLPMLAKSYKDEASKIDWVKDEIYVQPKLDGMRCLSNPSFKISRKNVPITTVDHIKVVTPTFTNFLVDGELYAHQENFQENMRLIKKYRAGKTELVKYHIYDVVSQLPFIDRYALAMAVVQNSENCELVPTFKIRNEEELKAYHQQFLAEGYEGTIIRWGNVGYQVNKRTSYLLKYKDFLDETYTIIDVLPSDKNPEQGIFQCQGLDKEGRAFTFGCGMKFSHEEREQILLNKSNYIGQKAEIRFFEYSELGIPRFPVCVGIRLDR